MDGAALMSDQKKDGDQSPKLTVLEGGKESPASKRRKLTGKQEAFLAGLIRGKTQYEAYCNAYDASGMKRSAIDNEAWRLAGHHEISRRLQAHHASVERAASASAGSRRRLVLERLEHEAMNAESDAARVRALELLGKTYDVGLFVERIETDNSDRSPDELRQELTRKLQDLLTG